MIRPRMLAVSFIHWRLAAVVKTTAFMPHQLSQIAIIESSFEAVVAPTYIAPGGASCTRGQPEDDPISILLAHGGIVSAIVGDQTYADPR